MFRKNLKTVPFRDSAISVFAQAALLTLAVTVVPALWFFVRSQLQPKQVTTLLVFSETAFVFATGVIIFGLLLVHMLRNEKLFKEMLCQEEELVIHLTRAVEFRDVETGSHVDRVASYTASIARAYGFSEGQAKRLGLAAMLHDIGKVAIPDTILRKPGPLTDEERKIVQLHTEYGGELLAGGKSDLLKLAHLIAMTHHERWDGEGYPQRLDGENIPIAGRICALADVFDALCGERSYKPSWSFEDAYWEVLRGSGTHFDPRVVEAFEKALPEIRLAYNAFEFTEVRAQNATIDRSAA